MENLFTHKIKTMKLSNWNKPAHNGLVMATGILGSLTAFTPQLLSVLHEAPFPISLSVDTWIEWLLKMATVIVSLITIFTKKPEVTPENS